MPFEGFDPGACSWFAELASNNRKDWFEANRSLHRDGIAAPLQALMEEGQAEYGGRVKLFRPHRDVRFSKDKSPYQTHQRALIFGLGPMALYAAIDAEGFYAGGGVYGFKPARLALFRDAIASDAGAELENRIAAALAAGCELSGEALKTVPRGYDKEHPRAELLKRKALILGGRIKAADAGQAAKVRAHAQKMWAAVKPVGEWLLDQMGMPD